MLRVQVAADALTVAHEGAAAAGDGSASPPRLDTREHVLGLGMIRRVCERRGWMLDESVDTGGGRTASYASPSAADETEPGGLLSQEQLSDLLARFGISNSKS